MVNDKSNNAGHDTTDEILQLVSFRVAAEEYGLDILRVLEIIRVPEITRVPQAPRFIDGIINLRGRIMPVINARRRFGLEDRENDGETRIVVIEIEGKAIGLMVDAVNEVLRLPKHIVEDPPGPAPEAAYITGVAQLDDNLLIILNPITLVGEAAGLATELTGRMTI